MTVAGFTTNITGGPHLIHGIPDPTVPVRPRNRSFSASPVTLKVATPALGVLLNTAACDAWCLMMGAVKIPIFGAVFKIIKCFNLI